VKALPWLATALLWAIGQAQPVSAPAAPSAPANPMHLEPDHVALSVADLAREEAWYTRVFGVRDVYHFKRPGFEASHMSLGESLHDYHIDLVWEQGSTRPATPSRSSDEAAGALRQGWVHAVFKTSAIDAAYQRLRDLGTDVQADRNAKGLVWRLYLHDPEGNELQIMAAEGEDRS
jgi:catechol 2,3-dioxygenase-like lactoylglutathione lyase family enzyme